MDCYNDYEAVERACRQLAEADELCERLPELTLALRTWSDCTQVGVGIRTDNDASSGDYPFSLSGVSPKAATYVSSVATEHGLASERVAQLHLACWSGHVLSHWEKSSDPYGTAYGSFRLNDVAEFSDGVPDGRRPPPCVRGRCRADNYRSLALIPVRNKSHAIGLLLFSDRRPGRFSMAFMACLEAISGQLALALACRKVQATLRNSENRFRTLLHSIPSVAFQKYGPNGTIQDWSLASEQLYGYTVQEAIGRQLKDLIIPTELHAAFDAAIQQMIATRHPIASREWSLVRKDGSRVPVFISHTVFQVPGYPPELYSVDIDLSQHQRLERERLIAETKFQQANKTKSLGRLAGAVAHHFNNQLQVVMGNLETGIDGLARGADILEILSQALNAAQKAANISSRMLTYAGQSHAEYDRLDLSSLCNQWLSTLRATIPNHVTLATDLPSPGPSIQACPTHIQKILTNLVTNAWEAIGDNPGEIHVDVSMVTGADIPLRHRVPTDWEPHHDHYACLEVRDTGCGIDEAEMENIVDPFYSSKFIGRGMGLAEVQGILDGYGSGITISKAPKGGSVFRVFLPAIETMEGRFTPGNSLSFPVDPDITILLVDDDPCVLQVTEDMLHRLGLKVVVAYDGNQAVNVFREHQAGIRLVLCDVSMPQMNGWQTLQELRKLAPDLPAILTSGYSEDEVMNVVHSEQPQVFLRKPYRLRDLVSAISISMTSGVQTVTHAASPHGMS